MNDEFIEAWTRLDETGKKIVKIKLLNPGASLSEIGRLLEPPVIKQAVHNQLERKPEIKKCLELIDLDAIRSIKSLFPLAILTLRKAMVGKNESLALDASKFILKKCADSDGLIPDSISDETLTFIYNDSLGEENGESKTEEKTEDEPKSEESTEKR